MKKGEFWNLKLRREREIRGWTQEELAENIGSDSKTISRWERAKAFPSPYYQQQLMKILGKSLEELGLIDDVSLLEPPVLQVMASSTSWPSATIIDPRILRWEDWGMAPSIEGFCGREQELATLREWIVTDHCKLIAILGMGGLGKTAFATKVAREALGSFDLIFWRSLQYDPSVENLLKSCLQFISRQELVDIPEGVEQQISLLINALRERRCLLIFDNIETVLQAGQRVGQYQKGYEGYGRLFRYIGEADHQSCLLLTSREKPQEVVYLEGNKTGPVRSFLLPGMQLVESKQLLQERNLTGADEVWAEFLHLYRGNPLALKIVAEPIQEIFNGDIAVFLLENELIIGDINDLLTQQFLRLSLLEQEIMYWLAIEREPVLLLEIRADITHPIMKGAFLDACDSLLNRSLIETHGNRFTLQPVIMEYVTERFVDQIYEEIDTAHVELFGRHALIKAQANDYIRESQTHSILSTLTERLLSTYGRVKSEEKLRDILRQMRLLQPLQFSYTVGNVLNLLTNLQVDLQNYDFSRMIVRQAYLQGIELPGTDFAHANLATCVFSETFTSIQCVAVSPDGSLLAVGTTTGEVLIRRADTLTPLFTCLGHADGIRSLAFNFEGDVLASGSEDQTIRLWDASTGHCFNTLLGHDGYVRSISFGPDGSTLASGGDDQTIRLWDIRTGHCRNVLRGHTHWVRSVAFSPDGLRVASGGEDQAVRIWDSVTGECLKSFQGHSSYIMTISFSPDGYKVASGSDDRTIRLWNIETNQCLMVLDGHTERVRAISYHPGGHMLASGSDDHTIRLWDLDTGLPFRAWRAHTNRIWSVTFFPAGDLLVSASEDETMRYWEVQSGRCLRILQGYTSLIKSVAFHPGGRLVATGNEDQAIRLWDVETGQCLLTLRGHINRLRTVAFSQDGTMVASGSEDETVRIWNTSSGECLKILQGHKHLIRSVAFSAVGNLLASGSHDQTIRIWEISSGRCINILPSQGTRIWSVAYSFDGTLLASGYEDGVVRIWDSNTGRCLKELTGHTHRVWSVAFNPCNFYVASSSDDLTIRIWNAVSGVQLNTLYGHTQWVRSVAISPNGNLLASGSHDQTVRIWDIKTGRCLKIMRGHSSCVWSVAFNPSGDLVASGSDDGTTKLWNVQTGACVRTLRSDRPYERMNITGVKGLTEAQKVTLKALGAIESM